MERSDCNQNAVCAVVVQVMVDGRTLNGSEVAAENGRVVWIALRQDFRIDSPEVQPADDPDRRNQVLPAGRPSSEMSSRASRDLYWDISDIFCLLSACRVPRGGPEARPACARSAR